MLSVRATPNVQQPRPESVVHPVLVGGGWRTSLAVDTFRATNPRTGATLDEIYPVSGWADVDAALAAADRAAAALRAMPDAAVRLADFLDRYAGEIETRAEALVAAAHQETALPVAPRLKDVELPRCTSQLRQAAAAARDGGWQRPTIDTKLGLRSCLAPIGPVFVIGPNNFPFAFNGISGGDFAAAIAAGNPVLAKGHPLHPTTTRLLAEAAHAAATVAGLPGGTVQLLYHLPSDVGLRIVADRRLKAVAFTGSRAGGLKLKAAADAAGMPFFGEMSSVNPVVLLPSALEANADAIADQFVASVTMGTGQFCTKPGLVLLVGGTAGDAFVRRASERLAGATPGVLFSEGGRASMLASLDTLRRAGAAIVTGGKAAEGIACCVNNTLLRATADQFLGDPHAFQTEAFGNASLVVVADDVTQLGSVIGTLEGNLTGTIYAAPGDADYAEVAAALRPKVGRLINDKMPTGVAVSPAMNHGGPFPATSQPHFTAVGIPASLARFTQLESYENVADDRLPPALRNANPTGSPWRQVDGDWTRANV